MNIQKIVNNRLLLAGIVLLPAISSCSDSWLEPKPLSFYTPENSYVNAEGFYSALTTCDRNLRHEYFGDGAPILSEMLFSETHVEGTTDKAGPAMDMDVSMLPDANLNHKDRTTVGWYWTEAYKAIKYVNIIISRLENVELDEKVHNEILGAAYFHRSYSYYRLTHQYGDVPYLDWEITKPKYDFYSYDRWSILKRLKTDMEFAYKHVPEKADRGRISNAAAGVLLMKICMALQDFDRAIEIGKDITAKHPLMLNRFTANKSKPRTNLMHDLHSVEAKLDMSNTEGLLYCVSYPNVDGSAAMEIMRNGVPFWSSGAVKTPSGAQGTGLIVHKDETDEMLDLHLLYGRGIGRIRPTSYSTSTIWTDKEANDLRGINNRDSWMRMEDLRYNAPALKDKDDEWYGKNLVKPVAMTLEDEIRCWYSWPHYKLYVPDPLGDEHRGGQTPWYIYRSAEVWLMLAESYYWKDDLGSAAEAMNKVRSRARADLYNASDVNIGSILDERARELYYEEPRKTELTRIAYTYAKTGKPCEIFGGRTYSLTNFSGPGGVSSNVKTEGVNFWWDRVNAESDFYNKGVKHKWAEYKISVHHVLWPVPASQINSNIKGQINQNIGYPGAENNVAPLIVPSEGTVLGPQ
jgi:hypothetical protein